MDAEALIKKLRIMKIIQERYDLILSVLRKRMEIIENLEYYSSKVIFPKSFLESERILLKKKELDNDIIRQGCILLIFINEYKNQIPDIYYSNYIISTVAIMDNDLDYFTNFDEKSLHDQALIELLMKELYMIES